MKRQILLGVLILLFIASFATAATLNVPAPYPTIQAAIDAAVDGVDEVVVADGTYSGVGNYDLNFWGKAITVRSVNGPANCIIDCQGLGRGFGFYNDEGSGSIVDGFTIKNGDADYGGGIECDNSSPTISNCIIIDNFASIYGGGVDLYMSSAVITNCKINNNSSNSDGGGINCDTDAGLPPAISFCEIIGNTTVYAGGGVNFYTSSAVVKNCLLKDNVAGDVGGAVYLWDSGPEISNCTIVDNTGTGRGRFGGIYRETFTGLPTIKNSILWNNGDDLYNCLGLISYSCVQDDDPGLGNISGDPMFRDGPLGSYYLSQEGANQLATSLCVDAGIGLASDLVGPYSYTTRTDSIADAGTVDMGYHYPDSGPVADYLLITTAGANGSINPNHLSPGSPYVQFAEVALTADPCEGYEVQAWTGADNVPAAGELNNIVTMDANKTVGVTFQAIPMYTLTFTAGANGEIIEPRRPGTYYKGTVVVLIVEPAPGYRVSRWTGADDLPGWNMNTNTVTMTSNKTVTVTFELDYSNIIHVPGDYPEIQLAIEAAANGDTIVLSDGLYAGKGFVVNRNITITGQTPEDPNLVVLDADLGVFAFELFGAGGSGVCTISGLTMINFGGGLPDAPDGVDPNNDGADGYGGPGAAVLVFGNHVISNCIIRNAFNGGGLAGSGADGSTSETYEIEDPMDPCEPPGMISVPDFGAQFAGNAGDGGDAYGAGIYINHGNPLIINTIIEDCIVIAGNGGNGGDGSDEVVDDPNFPGSPGGDAGVPGIARGGGVYSEPGTWPRFENCIIRNNVAVGGGGGDGGDAGTVLPPPDGLYIDHKGGYGGLATLDPHQPAPWTRSAFGGGVYVGGNATFTNCRFVNNQTYGAHSGIGGDHSIAHYQQPRKNYHIPSFGAGVYCPDSTDTTFTDCTFEDNETVYGGYPGSGVWWGYPPDVNVYDIDGPTGYGAAISIGETAGGTAHSVIIDCNFADNNSYFGGAFYGVNSDLRFEDCNFISNLGAVGGAVATAGESIAEISGSIFRGNVATYAPGPNQVAGTGGGLFCMETELLASNCIFTGNLAYNSGGGVYLGGDLETGNPVLNNCLITDNTAGRTGGGVACDWFVSPIISNCTIADNTTEVDPSYGGGLFCTMNSFPRVIDSIIWGNNASTDGGQIAVANGDLGFPLPSRLDITYSDVQDAQSNAYVEDDCTLNWGAGNIDEVPLFVDGYYLSQVAAGQDINSPCIDAGSNLAEVLGLQNYTTRTDSVRDMNIVDMGYHHPLIIPERSCDFDIDGDVDLADLAILLSYWLEQDCDLLDWCEGTDLDRDTDVDFVDYAIFTQAYGVAEGPPPPDDTTPPSPDPMTFEVYPHATSSTTIAMTATTATDESDVQYYFEDVYTPAFNSGWQDSPIWEDTNLAPSTTYTYWVKARDMSPLYNETEWSPPFDANTLAEGEEPEPEPNEPNEPPLQAPVIVGANQVEVGVYWHHVITAQATAEDPLYFRFECLNASNFNSAWVPRDGNAVDTFDHPVVAEMPDATITRGSGIITYDIAVGLSWNLWQWQVCGSNDPSGVPSLCSAPVGMLPPP